MEIEYLHAPILWAQRNDQILLTIDLYDFIIQQQKILSNMIFITGISNNQYFQIEIELFDDIKTESFKEKNSSHNYQILLEKQQSKYWPQLCKIHEIKNVHIDWNNYQSEDEDKFFQKFQFTEFN